MKIIIWIFSYLAMTLIHTLTYGFLANANSFVQFAEALLCLVAWILLSKTLCKQWDKHKINKIMKDINQKAESKGLTTDEYIKSEIPTSCFEIAEQYRGCPIELNAYLKDLVKSGKITKKQSIYMYQEFLNK